MHELINTITPSLSERDNLQVRLAAMVKYTDLANHIPGGWLFHIERYSSWMAISGWMAQTLQVSESQWVGHVWHIGRVNTFRPKGHWFDSRSTRHVWTLCKSFTHSCLWRFDVKFKRSIRAVSGAPLSSSGLEEVLYK